MFRWRPLVYLYFMLALPLCLRYYASNWIITRASYTIKTIQPIELPLDHSTIISLNNTSTLTPSFLKTSNTSLKHNDLISRVVKFDLDKDFLVFVHIQKTSGTNFDLVILKSSSSLRSIIYSLSMVKGLCKSLQKRVGFNELSPWTSACHYLIGKRSYKCSRPKSPSKSWYISWHESQFGWKCGLHPSLGDMKSCVEDRFYQNHTHSSFHYLTMIRDPIKRYISELNHVRKYGSVWVYDQPAESSEQKCLHDYMKQCVPSQKAWRSVSFEKFVSCPNNLATNRQTRMLADQSMLVNGKALNICSLLSSDLKNKLDNVELLERAIQGLNSLSFFGLTEYQQESRDLFNAMFKDTFKFSGRVGQNGGSTDRTLKALSDKELKQVERLNQLDLKLYKYAEELFFKRLDAFGIKYIRKESSLDQFRSNDDWLGFKIL